GRGARRDSRREHGVYRPSNHVRTRVEPNDPRLERAAFHLPRDDHEGVREVDDDTAQGNLGGDAILVRVRADDVDILRLARGLKYTEPGCVSVLEDHIRPAGNLREGLLPPRARIIPIAYV